MKKGLLLSVIASTMIFAGGEITPVDVPAPAADCSDFSGSVGLYFQTQAYNDDALFSDDASTTNALSATVNISVEKELFSGIGFGAELNGWSSMGLDNDPDNFIDGPRVKDQEGAQLSQMYLTGSFGDTAVKLGRFALPISLSPWAWTDNTGGVKDWTFEGVIAANTSIADTTIYGAYINNVYVHDDSSTSIEDGVWDAGADDIGLFVLGVVNTSVENTKITASGYYLPDAALDSNGGTVANYGAYLTVNTKLSGYKFDVQAAYTAGDRTEGDVVGAADLDATFALAARVSAKFGEVSASLAAAYINDGDYALSNNGAWWLYTANETTGEMAGVASTGVLAKASYKLGMGTLFASLGYWDYDTTEDAFVNVKDSEMGARLGYKFKVAGFDTKIVYRYRTTTYLNTTAGVASEDVERNRVRIEATYKF